MYIVSVIEYRYCREEKRRAEKSDFLPVEDWDFRIFRSISKSKAASN